VKVKTRKSKALAKNQQQLDIYNEQPTIPNFAKKSQATNNGRKSLAQKRKTRIIARKQKKY
jgi:hypothetical protein